MATLGRLLISSSERLDLPDLLSIDSYTAGDFKYLISGLIGSSKPLVLKGFDVIDAPNAVGSQSCSIRVADSVVFYPGSSAGSFFHGLPEGNVNSQPLVPELRKNATNYVYLTFSTFNTAEDTRAFWDPDKEGGAGGEFTQDVNTESVLKVEINVSTGSFPANTITIAKIKVGALNIETIEDCRDLMFRLGSGGTSPDPFGVYSFRSLPSSSFKRSEPSNLMDSTSDANSFQGADKNIYTLKEWMDVVMTKLKELGGTTFWYEDTSTFSLVNMFHDALTTTYKSKGEYQHSSATAGQLTWTENLLIKSTSDPREIILEGPTTVTLANEQVAYLALSRDQRLNSLDDVVTWINGVNYINSSDGSIGKFANLKLGDWVKKIADGNHLYLRVEGFFLSANLAGGSSSPANARSIRLSGNYQGSSENSKGRYDRGIYASSDVAVQDKNNPAITALGGNFHWIANRSDTIQNISAIQGFTLSGTLSEPDGTTAKVTVTSHGMSDGDRIAVTAPVAHAGTYSIEVEDANTFYIRSSAVTTGAFTAYYGLATTTTRSSVGGIVLESANHNFSSGETIIFAGTTNFNGSRSINVRTSTQVQFALSSAPALESTGTATLARLDVRSERGLTKIVQGETVIIGEGGVGNIQSFIGMTSLSQTSPNYSVPPSYDTLDGFVNYNSLPTDSLTARASKLTAMMADKAQDKTIRLVPSGYRAVSNVANGANREINFIPFLSQTPRVDVVMPGSANNGSISLSSSILLGTNQVAYFQVDRNNSFNISSLTIASIASVPINENVYIFAMRLSTNEVWLWDSFYLAEDFTTPIHHDTDIALRQNRTLKLVRGGQWYWDLLGGQLGCSTDAYIQIPGLAESVNTISSGFYSLASDGDVLYVEINRENVGTSILTVNTASISALDLSALDSNVVIIARRIGDDVIVGSDSMLLHHGEYRTLESSQNEVTVTVVDNVSTTLPTGASIVIDGLSLSDGDTVLFTVAGTSGIYMAYDVGTSVSWTVIDAFETSDGSIPVGSTVFSQDGSSSYSTRWILGIDGWRQLEHTQLTKEPTGFPNRTDSSISFNNSTRELTIAPTVVEFDVYQRGKPYRFDSAQSIAIPDVEGLHYVYFDGGVLQSTQAFTIEIIKEFAFVATIQWDAANNLGILVGEERHGLTMDGETHSYLHQSLGTRYISGLSAGGFTTGGTGNSNTDAQLSISGGRVRDEDIAIDIVNAASPSAPFEQILSPTAKIPVFYRSGASGDWRKDTSTFYPVKQGTGLIKYNNPAGPWTTPDATSGNFVAMWVFATNSITEPVIAVLGQRQDATLSDAQANNTYESLSFGTLPSLEMKVLYRLIFETKSTFTNAVGAALREVKDLRKAIDVSLGSYAPSDHGLLSGLTDQDHPDYSIFVNSPASYVGGLRQINVTDNNDVQKALQSLDRFFAQLRMRPHPSNSNRVILSGADQALTNSITLSQTIKGLMMSFDGAQIDFSTGSIYASDGITALGINFTPATIAASQYRWYSVNLVGVAPTNANNTVSAKVKVVTAAADGASTSLAPRAKYAGGGIKVGQVWVQKSGGGIAPITAANINQLGVGSGGGDDTYEFELANNQVAPADIVDMLVDSADNRLFKVEFGISRVYSSPNAEIMTQGAFSGIYRQLSATWEIDGYTYTGDNPEIQFSITSLGKVQYTSSNLPGTKVESMIKFRLIKL